MQRLVLLLKLDLVGFEVGQPLLLLLPALGGSDAVTFKTAVAWLRLAFPVATLGFCGWLFRL